MEFRKVVALRGPNVWASFPVLEGWLDLKELKDSPSNTLPGFTDRLMAWLPTLIEHQCSRGKHGGFLERLVEGTWPGHVLEHVALELHSLAHSAVGFGRTRETSEEGVYRVVIKHRDEALGRACLDTGLDLVLAAIHDTPFDARAAVARLRELAQRVCLGPSTAAIVKAAWDRDIPYRRLNEHSLVQLGHGSRQRRIVAAETDRTGAIAELIARDKDLTKTLLRAVGVPTPEGRAVESAGDAWEAALEIGVPVAVKPRDGNHGRGVTTGLTTREQVERAYDAAAEEGDEALVERSVAGDDYRLLVVGDRVVAAARREPARVTGDGVSTVAQLVERTNADPRRGDWHATALSKIYLDEIALAVLKEQGYAPDSVPPADARVLVRRNANLSTGGTAVDVTDWVHPDLAADAVAAAKVVGLDVAGIDVIAPSVKRPLGEQGGVVVEVNAGPGLRMHLQPSEGEPQPVGRAIVGLLFPEGDDGRIPLAAVTGVNGKTTTTRLLAHLAGQTGLTVGMACTDGIYVAGRKIKAGDCSGPKSARAVLLNPRVEAAVLEVARGGIIREGLGFDACHVAVVTNIGEGDHLGLGDVHTLEKLALVKQTVVEAVLKGGTAVLNADDPLVAAMAESCRGSVTFFARDGSHPVVQAHRASGGRAAFVRGGSIVLAEGPREEDLAELSRVPLTLGGTIAFQVENVLAAAAAAWALGLPLDTIVGGLATFHANPQQTPGRFNVLEGLGARVVIDYAHNPSAVRALAEALDHFPERTRVAVFTAAGDRRDEDVLLQGKLLGDAFDSVVLYDDPNWRYDRPEGETAELLRRGVASGARATGVVAVSGGEREAVARALGGLQPGDLLFLQPTSIEETTAAVRRHLEAAPATRTDDGLETAPSPGARTAVRP